MKTYILGAVLSFAIIITPTLAQAQTASLTSSQINAIIQLLQAFGADQSVINSVQTSLNGGSYTQTPQPVYPFGCTSYSGYSSTTGNACNGSTPTYPPGCSSTIGFSSTTGQACGLTTTPTIASNPSTPTGDPSYITTSFTTLSPVNTLRFNLKFTEAGEGYLRIAVDDVIVRTIDQRFAPPGVTTQEEVYIGDERGPLPPGRHKLVIRLDGFGANPSGVLLTDVTTGLIVTTTTATYPSGCTSYSGFSSTTGNACNGSTPTTTSISTGLTSTQINSLNSLLSSFGASTAAITNVNIILNGGTAPTTNTPSGLTSAQVQSILSLLASFGANSTTIANVNIALTSGGVVTATSPTTTTTTTTTASSGLTSTQIQSTLSLLSSFGANSTTIANVNIVLNGSTAPTTNVSSGLTSSQIQSILSLLSSFGANSTTIANVNIVLMGNAATGTTTTTTSTSRINLPGCTSIYSGFSSIDGSSCVNTSY